MRRLITGMNMFTFEFEMLITLCMVVSHSFCEKCQFFRPSVDEYVGDAYRNLRYSSWTAAIFVDPDVIWAVLSGPIMSTEAC